MGLTVEKGVQSTFVRRNPTMNMHVTRRKFLHTSARLAATAWAGNALAGCFRGNDIPVYGHLWVYASRFPPDWDCTPILEQVFSDFNYAGIEGVELMESNLRHDDIVMRADELSQKYEVPVTGSSYNGDMWDAQQHQRILEDAEMVLDRLHRLGGRTFGITVGNAGRVKTEKELDAQADLLKKLMKVCAQYDVEPNIHNHTFEVENDLHDLKGILARVPEIKLGPDLNWLVRGGVDPVWFIRNYGKQMVYMHIRDQSADGVWTEAVGEGVIDFPAIAAALKEVNFSGRAAIELAFDKPPEREVKESWKISREYVRKVFGW